MNVVFDISTRAGDLEQQQQVPVGHHANHSYDTSTTFFENNPPQPIKAVVKAELPATVDIPTEKSTRDPSFLVGWDGPDDIENPKVYGYSQFF